MSECKTVIFGAGGHAKVAIDTMRDAGSATPVACLDREGVAGAVLGVEICDESRAAALRAQGATHALIAVGDAGLREVLARRAEDCGFALLTLISRHAYVSAAASIGEGVVVYAGAVVQAATRIDRLAIINTSASVDHDCHVGAFSHIAPGAVLCGGVTVGRRCWMGARSVTIEQLTIADDVFVAAGAAVVRSILDPGSRYGGVPARPLTQA